MKILISYLTGIGNTIMCLPMLRALRQQLPDAVIDVMVRHPASKELLERMNCCRTVYVFNPKVHHTLAQRSKFLRQLRRERYDVNFTTFPSNRSEFNILSFLIGATRRIGFRYQVGYLKTLGFLQTDVVEANVNRHEVDHNLSLLAALGLDTSHPQNEMAVEIFPEEMASANEFLHQARLSADDLLIGFHPGCNPAMGNIYKRWPTPYFADLGDRLAEQCGANILVGFGGGEEHTLYQDIYENMKHTPVIFENAPILETAALIKMCRLFVAADSGLMHLATAMHVPTVALFGPVDALRSAPYGKHDSVLTASLPCVPCNQYPHEQTGGSYIRCVYEGEQKGACMQSISADQVYATIIQNYTPLLQSQ